MNSLTLKNVLIIVLAALGLMPLLYFVRVQYGAAEEQAVPVNQSAPGQPSEINRYVDNLAFGVGEFLKFDLNYGFINAGTATLEVSELVDHNGRPAYRLVSTANSNKFFSSFYPVRDRAESILDAVGLFSWRFDKDLREGRYRSHREYDFDQVNHKVFYEADTIEIVPYCQDALSTLYFVRTQPLEVGKSILVDNFTDGKKYPLEIKVHRRESIKTAAGTFNCLVVEPIMRATGIFKHEGKLTVWLTDDRLRLPVLMKSKVVVGAITAELTEYRLGRLEEF